MKNYLFVLDEQGRRVTSLVVGLHAATMEELQGIAARAYPKCSTLQGDRAMQAEFLAGKAWDGKEFYTPAPPPVDIEAVRRGTLARVRAWTEERITGGFYSGGVRYDSDLDTQVTMYGIRASVDLPRFKDEYPQGAPVRGYDKGAEDKTVHWLDADGVKTFCADMAAHIGACKRVGWRLQDEVEKAETVEALEGIQWPQEE